MRKYHPHEELALDSQIIKLHLINYAQTKKRLKKFQFISKLNED